MCHAIEKKIEVAQPASRKIQRRKPMIRLISPPYPPYRTEHTIFGKEKGSPIEGLEFLDMVQRIRNKK